MQESYEKFQKRDTEILAIVVDPLEANQKVKEKFEISFPILSDEEKKAIGKYGVLHKNPPFIDHAIARPAEFLIDKEGIIVKSWLSDSVNVRTRPQQILEAIEKHTSE